MHAIELVSERQPSITRATETATCRSRRLLSHETKYGTTSSNQDESRMRREQQERREKRREEREERVLIAKNELNDRASATIEYVR